MKKLAENILNNEIIRYIFIGICTTSINFAVFWVLCDLLHINITLSNVISITVAIIFAYVTNRIIVFQSKENGLVPIIKEFVKFFGSRIFTMLLEICGVWVISGVFNKEPMISKLATQFLVLVCNYISSKFIVFK